MQTFTSLDEARALAQRTPGGVIFANPSNINNALLNELTASNNANGERGGGGGGGNQKEWTNGDSLAALVGILNYGQADKENGVSGGSGVGRAVGASTNPTLQYAAHIGAVVTMLAPALVAAAVQTGGKALHPLAARSNEIHNAVQRQMGGWIRRFTTIGATTGEGQEGVAITVKVMKDQKAAERMITLVKKELKAGEVFAGASTTEHAEVIGIQYQQAQGAARGASGASNMNCFKCQNWVGENAPGFTLVNKKPKAP